MKNNLILGVQGLKKMLKGMFLVVGLFMVVAVDAKNLTQQQSSRATTGTTQQPRVPQFPPVNPIVPPRQQSGTGTTAQQQSLQPQSAATTMQTPPATAPAMSAQDQQLEQQKANQGVAWVLQQTEWPADYVNNTLWKNPLLSQPQRDQLTAHYNTLMARKAAAQAPYIASSKGRKTEEVQESGPGLVSQAWEGAKSRATAAAGWGWQKGKEALGYATSAPGAVWGYDASIPTSTKFTGATTAALAVPALGIAAPGALTVAAVGTAGYTALSLIDRLEHRYRTGHWTREGALKFEIMKLEQLISDSGKYPTETVKANALDDAIFETPTDESLTGDQFKISEKARTVLINRLEKELDGNQSLKNSDIAINTAIGNVRSKHGYSQERFDSASSIQERIEYLNRYKNDLVSKNDLNMMMAIISEYRRTVSKLEVLEEYKKAESAVKPAQ